MSMIKWQVFLKMFNFCYKPVIFVDVWGAVANSPHKRKEFSFEDLEDGSSEIPGIYFEFPKNIFL